MNTKYQLWSVWAGPVFLVLYIIAFCLIAGFVPPTDPSMSEAELFDFYQQNRNWIRAGQLLGMVFSALLMPWFAVISVQMARIEGRFPVLAATQFGGGVLLVVYFILCSMLWQAAAYRADLDPHVLRTFHDFSWITFVMVYPTYVLQVFAIALVGFMDRSEQPTFPRWVCFFNLWVGVAVVGSSLVPFFKTGPFAYNGLFAFYIPVTFFIIWLVIMSALLQKAVKRQAYEHAESA